MPPSSLHQAMRYAALGPGKRVRPALARLAYDTLGGHSAGLWPAAAALELAHAFSLVHDDLPCMDDDDLRRGRPTVHRRFGEPVALLAGDALLALSFQALAGAGSARECGRRERSLRLLAEALGSRGMVGGQVWDMLGEGGPASRASVRRIHRLKTAALMAAATRIGAVWAGAGPAQEAQLGRLGEVLGLAFQAGDDLLNATASAEQLGKAAGSDAARRKASLPRAVGLEPARAELLRLCRRARALARALPRCRETWAGVVEFVESRRC
ncbi:MAG TPA: polyprenyl synthetase family protein [Candidatus Saccharimonadales bacterium]|nr:polyprenyl synthetase family protein [Candidatus Saccharimonadales bacterium]